MTPEIRYYEWRWKDDVVIQWQRLGECNGCGACCRTLIKFKHQNPPWHQPPVANWRPSNGDVSNAGTGNVIEVVIGGRSRHFMDIEVVPDDPDHKPCSMLTENNRCRIHLGKPRLCSVYPMTPDHIAPFSECSFTFEEIGRWKISELSSENVAKSVANLEVT